MSGDKLDPSLHPYRPDLAAAYLEGRVEAGRFVEGCVLQVADEAAPVFGQPRFDAEMTSEALHGETVTVYEEREGWMWGQVRDDGYVGYLPASALSADRVEISPPGRGAAHLRLSEARHQIGADAGPRSSFGSACDG